MNLETDAPFPSPERFFDFSIRRPIAILRQSIRDGGPIQQWITRHHRQAMRVAATNLSPIPVRPPRGEEPAIALMTGANFWEQTIFCLHTLLRHTPCTPPTFLVDDGTLGPHASMLASRFPGIRIYTPAEIHLALNERLPAGEFPALRGHRRVYRRLRKLTDIHAVRPGWNLVLDSDILVFRQPKALFDWLAAPTLPMAMTSPKNTPDYEYSAAMLESLAGTAVPTRINTGITGILGRTISWRLIETWLASILLQQGSHHHLGHALIALHFALTPHRKLPTQDYVICPEASESAAVLCHYADSSKRRYFRHEWRHILQTIGQDIPSNT